MTQWYELYGKEHEPSEAQIKEFVGTHLWDSLDGYLQRTYNVKPKPSYSSCAMDSGMWKGWNVKYKKSGKSLCTLYPKQGYIFSLVPIGNSEISEAELLIPLCTEYTQNLWNQTPCHHMGKSLAFEVKDEDVLGDMQNLIALRVKKK